MVVDVVVEVPVVVVEGDVGCGSGWRGAWGAGGVCEGVVSMRCSEGICGGKG